MQQTLSPSHTQQSSGIVDEHWLDRAIEDKLGEIIDKYRAQGKDVHNVGALRNRVAADINGLRGTSQWGALKQKYDPAPQIRVAWCIVCDKPVNRGSVSAWLEDKKGWVFCSKACQDNTDKHPIGWSEFKRRLRDNGPMTTHRIEFDGTIPYAGEQITITWDDVKNMGNPIDDLPVNKKSDEDEIIWTDD